MNLFNALLLVSIVLCFNGLVVLALGDSRETTVTYDPQKTTPREYFSQDGASYSQFKEGGGKPSEVTPDIIQKNPQILKDMERAGDAGKLTSNQLTTKLPDGIYAIDKLDAGKLNKAERDKALEKLGRKPTVAAKPEEEEGDPDIETDTDDNPSQITTYDDGFEIDYIYRIRVDTLNVIGATDFSYRGGVIKVGKADTIEVADGTNFSS